MSEFNNYINEVAKTLSANTKWRYGQSLFNTLYDMQPEVANEIRGSELDPFYQERGHNFDEFFKFVDCRIDKGTGECKGICRRCVHDGDIKGGAGTCKVCGKYVSNVAYHESVWGKEPKTCICKGTRTLHHSVDGSLTGETVEYPCPYCDPENLKESTEADQGERPISTLQRLKDWLTMLMANWWWK